MAIFRKACIRRSRRTEKNEAFRGGSPILDHKGDHMLYEIDM